MKNKVVGILLAIIMLSNFLFAQPIPCEEPVEMTPTCVEACIICDIDGFKGRHESAVPGEAPPGFCTVVVHNGQWIAFIAGTPNLTLELFVSNCLLGNGLEVGIYASTDCSNFDLVSECRGGFSPVPDGGSRTFTNNVPLVVGQYYYLVMDGNFGDNCDWEIAVLEGSTLVDPLLNSGTISGEALVCPDQWYYYPLDPPLGATEFEWTFNGLVQEGIPDEGMEARFFTDGDFEICVTASNACDEAPPSCFTVTVESIPPTEIIDFICEGDCYSIVDTLICDAGIYEFSLLSIEGCDSLVILDLTEIPIPIVDVEVDICEGDTLYVGTTPYFQNGQFQETLKTDQLCDSIVNLDLSLIICNIQSTHSASSVICYGESSGQIDFSVAVGSPPFTFSWANLENTLTGNGSISALGEAINIPNLPAGTYLITISDGYNNFDIIIQDVNQPDPLALAWIPSDYNGFNLTCADATDGSLEAQVSGGVMDYVYLWDTGANDFEINNLEAGTYFLTVTDDVGCTLVEFYDLISPEALEMEVNFANPNCDGLQTGIVEILESGGGTAPYSFSLNGGDFATESRFDSLFEGTYELVLQDANGCEISQEESLIAPQIPVVEIGENKVLNLGDSYTFAASINDISIQEIIWTAPDSLSCSACLDPSVIPLNSAYYYLTVISQDDCPGKDSLQIVVEKNRRFYAPTAISPNFDGINDGFTIYGSQEVEVIQSLRIFNRWGAEMFVANNLEAGNERVGWNGTFNGKVLNPEVYVWLAEIRFIDGLLATYSGEIHLID